MATFRYIGPDGEHGDVPRTDFDEGVLDPDLLRRLVERGDVVEADSEPAPGSKPRKRVKP